MPARLVDVPGAERQALAPEAAWHTLSAEEVLRGPDRSPSAMPYRQGIT